MLFMRITQYSDVILLNQEHYNILTDEVQTLNLDEVILINNLCQRTEIGQMHIISASFVEDADIDSHTVTFQDIVYSISRRTKKLCQTKQLVSDVT